MSRSRVGLWLAAALVAIAVIGCDSGRSRAEIKLTREHAEETRLQFAAQRAALLPGGADGREALDRALESFAKIERSVIEVNPLHPIVDYSIRYEAYDPEIYSQPEKRWAMSGEVLDRMEQSSVLAALDDLAAAPALSVPEAQSPVGMAIRDELKVERSLARACVARMRTQWLAGNDEQFCRSFEHALALGRAAVSHGGMNDQSAASLNIRMVLPLMNRCLRERPTSEENYRRLDAAIAGQTAWVDRRAEMLALEKARAENWLWWSLTPEGAEESGEFEGMLGEEYRAPSMEYVTKQLALTGEGGEKPRDQSDAASIIRERLDFEYDRLAEEAKQPLVARYRSGWRAKDAADRIPGDLSVFSLAWNRSARGLHDHDEVAAVIQGSRALLAVLHARASTGALPASLDGVTRLDGEPLVDPLTGNPWLFKVLGKGEDAHGREFSLYSPGVDGRDDGGVLRGDGRSCGAAVSDWPGAENCDFVVNDAEGVAIGEAAWRGDSNNSEAPREGANNEGAP